MNSRKPHIVALICGSIRKIPDFLVIASRVLALKDAGVVDRVILSTWTEELESNADLHRWLQGEGVHGVGTPYSQWSAVHAVKALPSYLMSAAVQDTQMSAGFAFIRQCCGDVAPEDVVVWKLRTDLMIPRLEVFPPLLQAMRDRSGSGPEGMLVHHASTLDLFDIADITFVTKLSQAHNFGGLLPGQMSFYMGKHIPKEAIICGNRHTFAVPAFHVMNSLYYPERRQLRRLAMDCIAQGGRATALAELFALHLHIVANSYRIRGSTEWEAPFDIEALFEGGAVPGLNPYRELNHILMDDAPLRRIRAGTISARTPFGRDVERMLGVLAQGDRATTFVTEGLRISTALIQLIREQIVMDGPRKAEFDAFAVRYEGGGEPRRSPATIAASLGLMNVPREHQISPSELAAVLRGGPRDAPELARRTLHVLAGAVATGSAAEGDPKRDRLRYWANLFASMELLNVVIATMQSLDPGYQAGVTSERASHLKWQAEAQVRFASSPAHQISAPAAAPLDIAFCIFGQLRDEHIHFPAIAELTRKLNASVFISTWRMRGTKTSGPLNRDQIMRMFGYVTGYAVPDIMVGGNNFSRAIPGYEARVARDFHDRTVTEQQLRAYFPDAVIEIEDDPGSLDFGSPVPQDKNSLRMLYKVKACNSLKLQAERARGRRFDVVVRLRPDILPKLDHAILAAVRDATDPPVALFNRGKPGAVWLDDVIVVSNSEVADSLAELVEVARRHPERRWSLIHEELARHLKTLKVEAGEIELERWVTEDLAQTQPRNRGHLFDLLAEGQVERDFLGEPARWGAVEALLRAASMVDEKRPWAEVDDAISKIALEQQDADFLARAAFVLGRAYQSGALIAHRAAVHGVEAVCSVVGIGESFLQDRRLRADLHASRHLAQTLERAGPVTWEVLRQLAPGRSEAPGLNRLIAAMALAIPEERLEFAMRTVDHVLADELVGAAQA